VCVCVMMQQMESREQGCLDAKDPSGPEEIKVRRRPTDLRQGYLIQAFMGHAYFSHYLYRMKRAPDAACVLLPTPAGHG